MLTHPSVDENASQFAELDIGQTVSAEREGSAIPQVNLICYGYKKATSFDKQKKTFMYIVNWFSVLEQN